MLARSPRGCDSKAGPFGRRGKVEIEPVLVGVVHELPLIGEGAVVVSGELFQPQTPRFTDAERLLEEIDKRLGLSAVGSTRRQCAGNLEIVYPFFGIGCSSP